MPGEMERQSQAAPQQPEHGEEQPGERRGVRASLRQLQEDDRQGQRRANQS